jgi:hypothetical protein
MFLACGSADTATTQPPSCSGVPDAGLERPFTSFDSPITGDVSGAMSCAICQVDAAVYSFAGGPTFLQFGEQNTGITCSSPAAATKAEDNPSFQGHVQIPSPKAGTYASDQYGTDCTSLGVGFSVASFAGCPVDAGKGICDPAVQFTSYIASGTGICDETVLVGDWEHAGVAANVVGSWSVTLTSVEAAGSDPNVSGASAYKVHGTMNATLPAAEYTSTTGAVTLSLTF